MNYKGVIFDLDGTLVNSLTDLANSVNTVLTEYNLPTHDIESYKYRVGNGIKKLMERSLPQDKQYLLDEALAKFKQVYAKHNLDHTAPYEDILTLLKKLQQQNELLHKYNISVGAFIPSYNKARSPIKKGLPTLEIHRYQTASLAMRHLKLLGIDSIFIGDSLPTEDEIQELANLTDEYILLKAKKLTQNKDILKTLQQNTFTARLDEADGAIRTQESRALFKQIYICPEYIVPREIGSITLDNALYARYAGEMQIITHAQKKDNKINTIAKLLDSELILLPYIQPNSKFKIKI